MRRGPSGARPTARCLPGSAPTETRWRRRRRPCVAAPLWAAVRTHDAARSTSGAAPRRVPLRRQRLHDSFARGRVVSLSHRPRAPGRARRSPLQLQIQLRLRLWLRFRRQRRWPSRKLWPGQLLRPQQGQPRQWALEKASMSRPSATARSRWMVRDLMIMQRPRRVRFPRAPPNRHKLVLARPWRSRRDRRLARRRLHRRGPLLRRHRPLGSSTPRCRRWMWRGTTRTTARTVSQSFRPLRSTRRCSSALSQPPAPQTPRSAHQSSGAFSRGEEEEARRRRRRRPLRRPLRRRAPPRELEEAGRACSARRERRRRRRRWTFRKRLCWRQRWR